jgi:hypothetical protein
MTSNRRVSVLLKRANFRSKEQLAAAGQPTLGSPSTLELEDDAVQEEELRPIYLLENK